MSNQYWSLHTAKKTVVCDACGEAVSPKSQTSAGEYWKAKGGPRNEKLLRKVCCICHFIYGLPDDGWVSPPNGRSILSTASPKSGPYC